MIPQRAMSPNIIKATRSNLYALDFYVEHHVMNIDEEDNYFIFNLPGLKTK
jgi:hypothetical protein